MNVKVLSTPPVRQQLGSLETTEQAAVFARIHCFRGVMARTIFLRDSFATPAPFQSWASKRSFFAMTFLPTLLKEEIQRLGILGSVRTGGPFEEAAAIQLVIAHQKVGVGG